MRLRSWDLPPHKGKLIADDMQRTAQRLASERYIFLPICFWCSSWQRSVLIKPQNALMIRAVEDLLRLGLTLVGVAHPLVGWQVLA